MTLQKIGPKSLVHSTVGMKCPACSVEFKEGDFTTVVSFGPGGDPIERTKAREGRTYSPVGWEIHWACATGELS